MDNMEFDDTEGIFRRRDNQRSENSRRHHHHHNEQDAIRLDFDTEEDRGALERNTDEANPSGERGVKRNREAANLGKNEEQPAEEEVEEDLEEETESVQEVTPQKLVDEVLMVKADVIRVIRPSNKGKLIEYQTFWYSWRSRREEEREEQNGEETNMERRAMNNKMELIVTKHLSEMKQQMTEIRKEIGELKQNRV